MSFEGRVKMNEILLIILGTIGVIISLAVLYSMPTAFLKEFEKQCHDRIKERDKEIEDKKRLYKELRRWLFK